MASHQRVLIEVGGSLSLAGSSLGHFLLLLLTGDSSCESGILELETGQRGLEIHLAGGIGALELQKDAVRQ